MIKKRSIALFILLSIVTLGIYPIVAYCIMGNEVNKICDGDGKNNMFYLLALLLGVVTLGIYPLVWFYKAMNRLQDNAYRYGPTVRPAYSGNQYLLWTLLGAFLFGIGPIVAVAYFISDVNQFAGVFGYVQPLPYTIDQAQRAIMASNGAFAYQQEQMYYDDNQQEQMYYDPTQQEQMLYGATQQGPAFYAADAVPEYAEQNQIPNSFPEQNIPVQANHVDSSKATNRRVSHTGVIRGIAGMYDGYDFPIENNEEISIGTDPALASIVIDVNNEYISPKHCAIIFDANTDSYLVHDNSEYGTYSVESGRIMQGMPKQFGRGEQIYLGDERNVFRLG